MLRNPIPNGRGTGREPAPEAQPIAGSAVAPAPAAATLPADAPAPTGTSAPDPTAATLTPAPAATPAATPALPPAAIHSLTPEAYEAAIPGLAALLVDAVDGGASVNFLAGVTLDEAAAWWHDRRPQIADGTTTAFVATDPDGRVIGSTLLIRATQPNGPHRAEIGKVLVHREARRQGLARRLMQAAETHARADGRWLLILDTHTGTPAHEMYLALGWHEVGTIPDHSLGADGVLAPATYFWKDLR